MTTKRNKKIYVFLVLIICLCTFIGTINITYCAENKVTYTSCEQDLSNNKDFDITNYPINDNNFSPKVVQIMEADGNLFVYVYCPTWWLEITSLNLYTTAEISTPKNYDLKFINEYKTIRKYLVQEFSVSSEAIRYYNIPSIFRKYNSMVDKEAPGDNTISEVSFAVGQTWQVTTQNGENYYTSTYLETIEITSKYVGFVRYSNGFVLHADACDSHFVAFTTDKDIDKLLEADLEYITRSVVEVDYLGTSYGDDTSYGDAIDNAITLTYTDKVSNSVGLFGTKYEWERIQTVDEFVKENNLTSSANASILNKKWVLRFCETDYEEKYTSYNPYDKQTLYYTAVTDVTILRLKFVTDGVIYNMALVDNKQSGDTKPDNEPEIPKWVYWVIGILCLILFIVLLPILMPILAFLIKAIGVVLKYLFIFLWWLITWPFKFFKGGD